MHFFGHFYKVIPVPGVLNVLWVSDLTPNECDIDWLFDGILYAFGEGTSLVFRISGRKPKEKPAFCSGFIFSGS